MASISGLTPHDVSIIKARLLQGEFQHHIAADYGLNQGRICEIAKGKRFAHVLPATLSSRGQQFRLTDPTKHRRK